MEFVRNPAFHHPDATLTQVWNDREALQLRDGLMPDVLQAVVQILALGEEEEGFASKEFLKFSPTDPEPQADKQAVVKIIIPLNREVVEEEHPEEQEPAVDNSQEV